jgi:hypothetical protein
LDPVMVAADAKLNISFNFHFVYVLKKVK